MSKESTPAPLLAGLILAGGASTRMGSPKPIMPWGDQTFLQAVTGKMQAAGVMDILVVLGAHFKEVQQHCSSCGATPIFNQHWQAGQFSSLQAGIREMSEIMSQENQLAGLLVALVDQPHIASNVFVEVAQVNRKFPEKIITPSFNERRGHPLVIPHRLFSALLSMPPTATTRDFFRKQESEQLLVPVADAGIHFDIDTLEDLLLARERFHI